MAEDTNILELTATDGEILRVEFVEAEPRTAQIIRLPEHWHRRANTKSAITPSNPK